jgi:hypothetical protein
MNKLNLQVTKQIQNRNVNSFLKIVYEQPDSFNFYINALK